MSDDGSAASALAERAIADAAGDLTALSQRLHAHPEVAWEEERAAAWLAAALTEIGMSVDVGLCQLPTAFRASLRQRPVTPGGLC